MEFPAERIGPANQPPENYITERPSDNRSNLQVELELPNDPIELNGTTELTIELRNKGTAPAGSQTLYLQLTPNLTLTNTTPTELTLRLEAVVQIAMIDPTQDGYMNMLSIAGG